MGADVKGLDDIQKHLRDLAGSADPNTFNEWANRVGTTAKEICNDPDCKRIIQTIKTHLNSMPRTQQVIFEGFTTELKK